MNVYAKCAVAVACAACLMGVVVTIHASIIRRGGKGSGMLSLGITFVLWIAAFYRILP